MKARNVVLHQDYILGETTTREGFEVGKVIGIIRIGRRAADTVVQKMETEVRKQAVSLGCNHVYFGRPSIRGDDFLVVPGQAYRA